MKLSTGLFDYHLPEELIAQYPAENQRSKDGCGFPQRA